MKNEKHQTPHTLINQKHIKQTALTPLKIVRLLLPDLLTQYSKSGAVVQDSVWCCRCGMNPSAEEEVRNLVSLFFL
jgi:hypothetical protein